MSAATHPTSHEGLHPGSTFGSYRIVRLLGVGGMGSVFEGVHELLARRVAIKVLHARAAERADSRDRFLREAQSVARIKHPNVVEIFDVGILHDQPYIVMEYLEGEALDAAMARMAPMSEHDAVTILLPIAAALAAVHRKGLVHRDVKPENVHLASNATGHVVPKLVDFGIAKDLSQPIAGSHHTVIGTPHFMSPEQARGSLGLDARTDQYSFAVMLYQLVTGVMPYDAESLFDLVRAIDAGAYVPPRQLNAEISEEFETVLGRAMSRDAENRFPNMTALATALLPFASDRLRASFASDFADGTASDADLQAVSESLPPSRGRAPSKPLSTTTTLDRILRTGDGAMQSGTFVKNTGETILASPTPMLPAPRRNTTDVAGDPRRNRTAIMLALVAIVSVVLGLGISRFLGAAPEAELAEAPGTEVAASPEAVPLAPAAAGPAEVAPAPTAGGSVGSDVAREAPEPPSEATTAPTSASRRGAAMQRAPMESTPAAPPPTPMTSPALEIRLER